MRLLPVTPNLSLVLDFGLSEEEYIETCRTRAGLFYVSRCGLLYRGADKLQPTETWSSSGKRWAPYRDGPLIWTWDCSVISEREAERLMWPEYFAEGSFIGNALD